MRIRKFLNLKLLVIICTIFSSMTSCTYYTAAADEVKALSIADGETFIYVRNQFQFFLREVTVWTLEDFASNSPTERHEMRKFTVGKRVPTEDNVLEQYKITLFNEGKPMFNYVLKKIDNRYVKDSPNPFLFQLETDTGNVLMTMTKNVDDDIWGFDVNVGNENYVLTGKKGVNKNIFGAVLNTADNEQMLFCMKKNVSYFSDRVEFDIKRIDNPIEDVVYISVVTACDSQIRKVSGGGYRN